MGVSINSDILNTFGLSKEFDVRSVSPLTLAYVGDAVFELIVRSLIVAGSDSNVTKYHKKCIQIVNASAQRQIFEKIRDNLSDSEMAVYKRGRNGKSYSMPKNASPADYRVATGFECLCGYLYLSNQSDRLLELLKNGLDSMI